MTNKTINGVPRDLIEQSATLLDAHSSGPSIESNLAADLRALLAAPDPIVKADGIGEPVAWAYKEYVWVTGLGGSVWRLKLEDESPDTESQNVRDVQALYSADQVAALQSTIAQLKADNERIQRISDNYSALLMDANAENERLRDGLKLPDYTHGSDFHDESMSTGWNACLDEVRRMNVDKS